MSSHSILRVMLVVVGLILFTSCSLAEPVTVAGVSVTEQLFKFPQDKVEPVCKALESAGYSMPYGPVLPWSFEIDQQQWVLSMADGTQLTTSHGKPTLFIIVDWRIPADLDKLPDAAVSQATIEQLAGEAKKVCHIVQQEATKQGIASVDVSVRLWDLIVGTEIQYGRPDAHGTPQFTGDCDQMTGAYFGKYIGLNTSGPVPGHCPSLYVSADKVSHVRMDEDDDRGIFAAPAAR